MPLDLVIENEAWGQVPNLELMAEQAVAAALPKGEQGKIITLLFADDTSRPRPPGRARSVRR